VPGFASGDKLLWTLARRLCAGWREHLAFVTPETVVRWLPQGWRLFWLVEILAPAVVGRISAQTLANQHSAENVWTT
jgi:hypothetical protein